MKQTCSDKVMWMYLPTALLQLLAWISKHYSALLSIYATITQYYLILALDFCTMPWVQLVFGMLLPWTNDDFFFLASMVT